MTKAFIDIELGVTEEGKYGAIVYELDPKDLTTQRRPFALVGYDSEDEAYEEACKVLDQRYGKNGWSV